MRKIARVYDPRTVASKEQALQMIREIVGEFYQGKTPSLSDHEARDIIKSLSREFRIPQQVIDKILYEQAKNSPVTKYQGVRASLESITTEPEAILSQFNKLNTQVQSSTRIEKPYKDFFQKFLSPVNKDLKRFIGNDTLQPGQAYEYIYKRAFTLGGVVFGAWSLEDVRKQLLYLRDRIQELILDINDLLDLMDASPLSPRAIRHMKNLTVLRDVLTRSTLPMFVMLISRT